MNTSNRLQWGRRSATDAAAKIIRPVFIICWSSRMNILIDCGFRACDITPVPPTTFIKSVRRKSTRQWVDFIVLYTVQRDGVSHRWILIFCQYYSTFSAVASAVTDIFVQIFVFWGTIICRHTLITGNGSAFVKVFLRRSYSWTSKTDDNFKHSGNIAVYKGRRTFLKQLDILGCAREQRNKGKPSYSKKKEKLWPTTGRASTSAALIEES